MTIDEAAQLVIQAGAISNGKTYILDMGKPIKILELAKMINLRGLTFILKMIKMVEILK